MKKTRFKNQSTAPGQRTVEPALASKRSGLAWFNLSDIRHLLLLLAVVTAAYLTSFGAGLVIDNHAVLVEDPRIRQLTLANLKAIFTQDYWPLLVTGTYRPITTLTYLFNYALLGNGVQPFGYHLLNLLIHLVNALLVYWLFRRVLSNRNAALLGAAVFGVHPAGTEAVTNIVGRADLLAACGVLAGTACYIRARDLGAKSAGWLTGLGLAALVGSFAKESAITVLGVVLWFELLLRPGTDPASTPKQIVARLVGGLRFGAWLILIPIALLFAARSIVYAELIRLPTGVMDNPLVAGDFWSSRLTALGVQARYFGMFLWPSQLSCDYSFNQIPLANGSFSDTSTLLGLIGAGVVAAGLLACWRCWRSAPELVFFAGFYAITMSPTSNLLILIGTVMGDRFLYLPGVGLAGLAAWGFAQCSNRSAQSAAVPEVSTASSAKFRQGLAAAGLAAVTALSIRTALRNLDWRDHRGIWTSAAKVSPNSYKVHSSLASVLIGNENRPADLDGCLKEAGIGREIVQSVSAAKQPRVFLAVLGNYYRIKGDSLSHRTSDGSLRPSEAGAPWYAKARLVLERAEKVDRATNDSKQQEMRRRGWPENRIVDTGYNAVYSYLGDVLVRMSEYDKSRAAYEYYRHLNPAKAEPHLRLAVLELARSNRQAAVRALIHALIVDANQRPAWKMLVENHRQLHASCEATVNPGSKANLKVDCPDFQNSVCEAGKELQAIFTQAKQPANAQAIAAHLKSLGACSP